MTKFKSRKVPEAKNAFHQSVKKRTIPNLYADISSLTTTQRCELIAEISESILEDPQGAFQSVIDDVDDSGDGNSTATTIATNNSDNNKKKMNNEEEDNEQEEEQINRHRKLSKMDILLQMTYLTVNGNDAVTSRLALLSLLAIFQDIVPSYRIRLPTDAERSVRVSKETKQLWDYESALLMSYKRYLKILNIMWEDKTIGTPHYQESNKERKKRLQKDGNSSGISALSVTAILCLCELLKSAPHFNFRSNILSIVVKQMNYKSVEEVSTACCKTISHIFQNDEQGEVAQETTKLLCKTITNRFSHGAGSSAASSLNPTIFQTFLSLPLRVHVDEAQAVKIAEAAKAKMKKKEGGEEMDEIERDMKEGDATVDKLVLARSQTDTLHSLTLVYFQILKQVEAYLAQYKLDYGDDDDDIDESNGDKRRASQHSKKQQSMNSASLRNRLSSITAVLTPVLQGIAKFSHLINFDVVADLMKVLKRLLQQVELLPLEVALNCILTSLRTLEGAGRELPVDQKEYLIPLYNQLPRLISNDPNSRQNCELAMRCLNTALLKRKDYSTDRITAFVKRIYTVCLQAPAHVSIPLLAFNRQLVGRYPVATQLLENEQELVASGLYVPTAHDPEQANSSATSAWELATLRFSIDPLLVNHASNASENKILQLPVEDPMKIVNQVSKRTKVFQLHKKKHPLLQGGNKKRKRQQARFIKPRKTRNLHLRNCF